MLALSANMGEGSGVVSARTLSGPLTRHQSSHRRNHRVIRRRRNGRERTDAERLVEGHEVKRPDVEHGSLPSYELSVAEEPTFLCNRHPVWDWLKPKFRW